MSCLSKRDTLADLGFDETYNIREAIDFLTDKLALREKLIQSARQYSERDGSQKYNITIKRFEDLLADFLRLYQPIVDKISGHKETLQKEILNQRQALIGVTGMIEVAKGVEVLAERVKELESEAKGIETVVKDRTRAIERIDFLLGKTRQRALESSARMDYELTTPEPLETTPELVLDADEPTRRATASGAGRKGSR